MMNDIINTQFDEFQKDLGDIINTQFDEFQKELNVRELKLKFITDFSTDDRLENTLKELNSKEIVL